MLNHVIGGFDTGDAVVVVVVVVTTCKRVYSVTFKSTTHSESFRIS